MSGQRKLAARLVAGLLILLGISVAIPATVVSSYIPPTVTRHRAIWISLLIGEKLDSASEARAYAFKHLDGKVFGRGVHGRAGYFAWHRERAFKMQREDAPANTNGPTV